MPTCMHDNILIVEDEAALRLTLGDRLRKAGYAVDFASDGDEAFERALVSPWDLIILDIMLPKRNGFAVCRDVRQAGLSTPILMLTAHGQTKSKVFGFKVGADDYLTKPFDMLELMARVEALLRRGSFHPIVQARCYRFGSVHVDIRATEATRDGKRINLSAREFQLLRYFLEHASVTLPRQELLKHVWGYSTSTLTRTVDVHVASLRQKLEADPKQPQFILTVPGLGYKFE